MPIGDWQSSIMAFGLVFFVALGGATLLGLYVLRGDRLNRELTEPEPDSEGINH
ncbi:MAG TPA: hypothetical protein VG015_05100 [Candidatus Dormibacteraeota bacterium]|nr:hypothetical protein [Candidatus Dormibacteraeota bacterium]